MRSIRYFFLLIILLATGCNKEVVGPYDCSSATDIRLLPETLWQDISKDKQCSFTADPSVENFYIIRTESQYSFLVSCLDGAPVIDFDAYTLLVGIKPFADDVTLVSQSILKDCGAKVYRYTIEVEEVAQGNGSVVYYTALVPRLPDDFTVEVTFIP